MSYYKTNFYENPEFYNSSDHEEPVPGWGLHPAPYANPRVGVGALALKQAIQPRTTAVAKIATPFTKVSTFEKPIESIADIPWYYLVGGTAVVVGTAGFLYYYFG